MDKKTFLLFRKVLSTEGGAERFMLETARALRRTGARASVVVLNGTDRALFDGKYANVPLRKLRVEDYPKNFFSKVLRSFLGIFELRRFIQNADPDFIIAQNPADTEVLYFATLGTKYRYMLFVPSTIFRFPEDTLKYTLRFRGVFEKVRNSVAGHKTFIPATRPRRGLIRLVISELRAVLNYMAVRRARSALLLTRQMGEEMKTLYRKDFVIIKAGLSRELFRYKQKQDVKKKLGIEGKIMVLNINRLDPRKRIDLVIRAFAEMLKIHPDSRLVIGGKGQEKHNLEKLISDLGLKRHVMMVGYVPEDEVFDFYASCDVFIHPDWADFDLALLEALALGKRAVCSIEVDIDKSLSQLENILLFPAYPDVQEMSNALIRALQSRTALREPIEKVLENYTWDSYAKNLLAHAETI